MYVCIYTYKGPLPNEYGTYKTVKARFWPWLESGLDFRGGKRESEIERERERETYIYIYIYIYIEREREREREREKDTCCETACASKCFSPC